jgi:hypothetical protein
LGRFEGKREEKAGEKGQVKRDCRERDDFKERVIRPVS